MLELASLIKNMKKSSRSQVKKKKLPSHINEAKTFKLMENPFSFVKSPKKVLSTSKFLTKESEGYCDLSISYTSDFPEPPGQESLLINARNSLIDLRTEAQLYLDSSRRVSSKKARDSIVSQNESLHRHSISNSDHLSLLIQNMHQTLKQINRKLEKVDEKSLQRDEENRVLKSSLFELKTKNRDCPIIKKQYRMLNYV